MLMIISVMITVGVERVRIGVRPIATIVIDMRFALKTRVVPVDHVLGGGVDPPGEGAILGVVSLLKILCTSDSAKNTLDKLQFLLLMFAVLLSKLCNVSLCI